MLRNRVAIAMLLCEHASTLDTPPSLQVFATDLDESAIRIAREGLFGESITVDEPIRFLVLLG
jgi:two-component system CheB/CheR fusion protein